MSLLASSLVAGYTCRQSSRPPQSCVCMHVVGAAARQIRMQEQLLAAAAGTAAAVTAGTFRSSCQPGPAQSRTLTQRLRASSAFLACM